MKTLNKIGIGAALAASTLAVGMSSAQAAVFGTFDITGTSRITADEIIFSNARVEDNAPLVNSFTPLANTQVFLSNISLANGVFDGNFTTTYEGSAPNPFITFAAAPDLFFTVDNPFTVSMIDVGNGVAGALAPIQGIFTNGNGDSTGRGIATFNFIDEVGSFSLTLEATPIAVPEPTTTLGLAALGLGAFATKSMGKKKKEKANA
jgi:hypothetical protein